MSSALLATLFAILGSGLAATSAACWVLWRRVRALTSSPADAAETERAKVRDEVARQVAELAVRHRAMDARLSRIEASSTSTAIGSHPGGPRLRAGRRVDRGSSATFAGPTLISVPDLAAPPSSNSEAAAELDRRFGPVWAMADDGAAVDVIARETGYPIGQVELILGLRRRLLVAEAGPDA